MEATFILGTVAMASGKKLVLSLKLTDVAAGKMVARHQTSMAADPAEFATNCESAMKELAHKAGDAIKKREGAPPPPVAVAPPPPVAQPAAAIPVASTALPVNMDPVAMRRGRALQPPPPSGRFSLASAKESEGDRKLSSLGGGKWNGSLGFINGSAGILETGEVPQAKGGVSMPPVVDTDMTRVMIVFMGAGGRLNPVYNNQPVFHDDEQKGSRKMGGIRVRAEFRDLTSYAYFWLDMGMQMSVSSIISPDAEAVAATTGEEVDESSILSIVPRQHLGVDFLPIWHPRYRSVFAVGIFAGLTPELAAFSGRHFDPGLEAQDESSDFTLHKEYGLRLKLQMPEGPGDRTFGHLDFKYMWQRGGDLKARYGSTELGIWAGPVLFFARIQGRFGTSEGASSNVPFTESAPDERLITGGIAIDLHGAQ